MFNNGVYKAGFATTQEVYEEAANGVFETLDELDTRLADRRYLFGDRPAETDWRLFTTLIRTSARRMVANACGLSSTESQA